VDGGIGMKKRALAVALTGSIAGTVAEAAPVDISCDGLLAITGDTRTWAPADFDSLTSCTMSRTGFFVGGGDLDPLEELALPTLVDSEPTGAPAEPHWLEEASHMVEIVGALPFNPEDDRLVEQLMSKRLGAMRSQKLGQ